MKEIGNVLFEKDIPKEMDNLFDGKAQIVDELLRHANEGKLGPWIRDGRRFRESCFYCYRSDQMQRDNPGKWKWGKFHEVAFKHTLSAIKPLNLLLISKARFRWAAAV
jgi:penicillin G amidase